MTLIKNFVFIQKNKSKTQVRSLIINYCPFLMKSWFIYFFNTYYLIIFNNCLICQRVYDQNRLNSSKARDLSRLETKPTSLPENLRNFA